MPVEFRIVYAAFETAADPPLTVAGRLDVPQTEPGEAPVRIPGVLICHGSDGVDGRGQFYGEALRAAGFATFVVDMGGGRTPPRGAAGGPSSVPQTLPDAFAALAFLAAQPEIDPARIAVVGFSWGGVISLLSATRRYAGAGPRFAAHAAFYPALWSYNRAPGHEFGDLTGAPVLIQAGGADAYDDPEVCDGFLAALAPADRAHVELVVHEGATHAFDRNLPPKVINDPYAHKGKGGDVLFEFNAKAAADARRRLVAFLAEAFARALA
jgi:dienelactone hydrolase